VAENICQILYLLDEISKGALANKFIDHFIFKASSEKGNP
jgi:hypothetical protein